MLFEGMELKNSQLLGDVGFGTDKVVQVFMRPVTSPVPADPAT